MSVFFQNSKFYLGDTVLGDIHSLNSSLPLIESMIKFEITGILRDVTLLLRMPNLKYFHFETWAISSGSWTKWPHDVEEIRKYLPKNCQIDIGNNNETLRSMSTPDSVVSFDLLLGNFIF